MYSLYNGVSPTELEPSEFSIGQNYPNPFKEKTIIKYCVAYKTRVTLTIYNEKGEEIEKLVDEEQKPGTYEVEFYSLTDHFGKSKNLLDGYYFYQMIAGDYSSEKKWLCINNLLRSNKMKTFLQTLFFFLLTTQICFGQWVQVGLNGETIKDVAVQNSNIFAITEDNGKLYRSIDNGTNWTMIVDSGAVDVGISPTGKVFMVKDSLIVEPSPRHSFYSVDNGDTWIWSNLREQLLDSITCFRWPEKITISPTGIIYCDINASDCLWGTVHLLARSTDDGLTWSTPGYDVIGGEIFDFRNNFVLTAGSRHGFLPPDIQYYLHLSSDYGISWNLLPSALGWQGNGVFGLFTNDNIIMKSGTYDTVWVWVDELFITMDRCNTWTKIASIKSQVGLSWSSGSTEGMIIGTDIGVFLFSDEGDSLGSRNEGLTNLNIHTLSLDNNGYVYAGTENGVWRRPLSEIVTSVRQEPTQPTEFILSQSYPNPFNSSCAIRYSIPQLSQVSLKVFNTLGEEIQTLVNEEKPVGTYELNWYASNLPSGVYFYKLQSGQYTSVKKMILLK